MPGALKSPQKQSTKAPLQKNVKHVVLGDLQIDAWYASFYPKELITKKDQVDGEPLDRLFVCPFCFRYTIEVVKYAAHLRACPQQQEPAVGDVVYEKDGFAIHRLDGEENKLYAQNLSLFAKLFLDTKSVFFDVASFLYYTLVLKTKDGAQVVGFFSKEKMSWDNNNVACILVFPPWQRQGLGQILMGASYVLGRREGRFGGPERPLSKPGQGSYTAFWCGEVCRYILQVPNKKVVTIKTISDATWILQEDIVTALKEMNAYEQRKTSSGNLVINKAKVRLWAEEHDVAEQAPVDLDAFVQFDMVAVSDEE